LLLLLLVFFCFDCFSFFLGLTLFGCELVVVRLLVDQ